MEGRSVDTHKGGVSIRTLYDGLQINVHFDWPVLITGGGGCCPILIIFSKSEARSAKPREKRTATAVNLTLCWRKGHFVFCPGVCCFHRCLLFPAQPATMVRKPQPRDGGRRVDFLHLQLGFAFDIYNIYIFLFSSSEDWTPIGNRFRVLQETRDPADLHLRHLAGL